MHQDGQQQVSVLVADDHPLYRTAVVRAVSASPGLRLVADHGDGREALEAIAELRPDVAVLDIRMPGMHGIDVVRGLRTRGIDTAVLLLTGSEDAHSLYEALAAGASGYMLKTAEPGQICDAIAALARGEVRWPPSMHVSLAQEIRAREHESTRPVLAAREREVLALTAAGRSAADVAADLHVSVPTVRSHLQNAYQKLEVSTQAAAVAKAMRLGLID